MFTFCTPHLDAASLRRQFPWFMFLSGDLVHMDCTANRLAAFVIFGLIAFGAMGCGDKSAPVDATPFRQPIDDYLRSNNMALVIKEIKAGPTIIFDMAQLSASLTHEQLGGPSVTWSFHFERRGQDGEWTVVRHED